MTTPTPPSDLIAEMAQAMEEADTHWQDYAHLAQAAYAVVRERIEELEALLEPLAQAADRVERRAEVWGRIGIIQKPGDGYTVAISLGKCRQARSALNTTKGQGNG